MSEDLAEAQDASEGIEPADLKVSFLLKKNSICLYFHCLFSSLTQTQTHNCLVSLIISIFLISSNSLLDYITR
jgi:hypothetical protein